MACPRVLLNASAQALERAGYEVRDLALSPRPSFAFRFIRDIERALQARYVEVKAQQRKNRCSSDDVWSIWCAAKSGEAKR